MSLALWGSCAPGFTEDKSIQRPNACTCTFIMNKLDVVIDEGVWLDHLQYICVIIVLHFCTVFLAAFSSEQTLVIAVGGQERSHTLVSVLAMQA